MTKGRAALPGTVVAEQEPLFITLGGPTAHDFSGRDEGACAPVSQRTGWAELGSATT